MENSFNSLPLQESIERIPPAYWSKSSSNRDEVDTVSPGMSPDQLERRFYEDISESLSCAKRSLPRGRDLPAMLTHLVAHLLRFYDKNREYYRTFVQHMMFAPKNSDSILTKLQQEQFTLVVYIIEIFISKNKISKDISAHQAAVIIFDIYMGLLVNFLCTPKMTVNSSSKHFSTSVSLLYRGIIQRCVRPTGFFL